MVRRKIKIKRIENPTSRQVTFSKRRGGLLKKAHDLSVLCDAEVGVLIFSSKGKLFQFASPSMESVLERYVKSCKDLKAPDNSSSSDIEADRLTQFIETLKTVQSKVIGDDLEHLTLRDLIQLEQQIHGSLGRIRAKKEELLLEQIEDLKEKVFGARRTTTGNANIMEQLVEFGLSEISGPQNSGSQGDSEHGRRQQAPQRAPSLRSNKRFETSTCKLKLAQLQKKKYVIAYCLNAEVALLFCNKARFWRQK